MMRSRGPPDNQQLYLLKKHGTKVSESYIACAFCSDEKGAIDIR